MLVTAAAATMLAGYRRHCIKHFIQEKNSSITDKGRIQHIRKLIHKSIRASQTKEKGSTHHKSTHPQIDSYITDKGAGLNTQKNSSTPAETQEHQKGRLPRRHSAAASSFSGGRARLPPPPSAGAPLLPSGATALSPPSLPQAMRARRPDSAVGKPDPVAGRPDPVAGKPDLVAGKPDPVAGNAGGGGPLPTAALLPFNSSTSDGDGRASRTSLPRPPWVRTACSSTSDGDGRASSIFTRTAPPRR